MVATALTHLLPGGGDHTLTPEEQEEVEAVLDMATFWVANGGPTTRASSTGALPWNGHPSAAYTRFVALHTTPVSDPRRADLLKLIDRLITESGWIRTEQGLFSPEDLGEHDVALHWRRTADQPDPWR